jgi:hypothetical protein
MNGDDHAKMFDLVCCATDHDVCVAAAVLVNLAIILLAAADGD